MSFDKPEIGKCFRLSYYYTSPITEIINENTFRTLNSVYRFEILKAKERIVCAAIHDPLKYDIAGNPLIHCGLTHANILWQSEDISRNPYHQGFLTSYGRFVDRKEALLIAIENNQLNTSVFGDLLYSEYLY